MNKYLTILVLSTINLASTASAVDENKYKEIMQSEVMPFYESQATVGDIETPDATRLRYRVYEHPEAVVTVLLIQGWEESAIRQAEMIYDLYQHKISIVTWDWRGQGDSQRLNDDPHVSYVSNYDEFVEDLETIMTKVVKPRFTNEVVPIAHSMGGHILARYVLKHPNHFNKIVLSSPGIDPSSGGVPEWLIWFIAKVMELLGMGQDFFPGQGPFDGTYSNYNTNSDQRYRTWFDFKMANRDMIQGGASASFLRATLDSCWEVQKRLSELKMPILMLQGGKDLYVDAEGMNKLCEEATQCQRVYFPEAMHEVLNEIDLYRDQALGAVVDFVLADTSP